MGGVLQVPMTRDYNSSSVADKNDAEADTFQALLSENTVDERNIPGMSEEKEATDEMDGLEDLEERLHHFLDIIGSKGAEHVIHELTSNEEIDWTEEEMEAFVHQLLEQDTEMLGVSVKSELLAFLNNEALIDSSEVNEIKDILIQSNEKAKMIPYLEIMEKARRILQTIQTSGDIKNHSKALLPLLEQWTQLTKQQGTPSDDIMRSVVASDDDSDEVLVWRELVKAYQKRSHLVQNRQYHSNAKVTRHDAMKWLRQLMPQSQGAGEKAAAHQMTGFQSTPMSQIEQYVIHVEHNKQVDSPGKQLIDQFQNLVHSSRFLTHSNGTSQLSISLHPENLGDMMLKLTQINGDLTAKILVSSHAAKEMLEANLHQLRHMFSPHNVVIERTDGHVTSQEAMNDEGEESFAEQEEQHKQQEESTDGQNDSQDDEFKAHIEELLWNEKV